MSSLKKKDLYDSEVIFNTMKFYTLLILFGLIPIRPVNSPAESPPHHGLYPMGNGIQQLHVSNSSVSPGIHVVKQLKVGNRAVTIHISQDRASIG